MPPDGQRDFVVHAAAAAAAGIAMLPTYYVAEDLRTGRLVRVLPQYTLDPMDIQAVYLSRRYQPRPLRLLIHWLSFFFVSVAIRLREQLQ